MDGVQVREVFESILPDAALRRFVEEAELQQRCRKLDAVQFLRAMVIAGGTGYGGRQADVARVYFDAGTKRVVRGGFYAWFNPRLEAVMEQIRDQALAFVASHDPDLPGFLGAHVLDWHIVDSTTIKLPDALREVFPGAGDYAALKIHKRLSVGIGAAVDYHLSPAREHDAPHLTIDASWRRLGLLADLGYASFKLLRDCLTHDVKFVIRLKESWKPRVTSIARGEVTRTFFAGTDLAALINQEVLQLRGKVVDAEVELGAGNGAVCCRLVGVPMPAGSYRFFLTNLPPTVGPHQISDLYRVRWEIESDNKLDKSCFHLDSITAQTPHAVRALVHASMVGSMIANLIAHRHRMTEAPSTAEQPRTQPPIHPQVMGRAMGSASMLIAAAMDMQGPEADLKWQWIADHLYHLGKDPNWRRRPSILDQLRGWPIAPGRPRKARLSSRPSPN
ncbi:MAG TPA: IS4 family transposase [Kofleriaceae bacterium]|nr:IS4 family transposase [Kofleriaceae bacterium]